MDKSSRLQIKLDLNPSWDDFEYLVDPAGFVERTGYDPGKLISNYALFLGEPEWEELEPYTYGLPKAQVFLTTNSLPTEEMHILDLELAHELLGNGVPWRKRS